MSVTVESLGLNPLNTERHKDLFNMVDTDGNGIITYNELKVFLNTAVGKKVPRPVRRKIFKNADSDGNGVIDFQEFQEMMDDPDHERMLQVFANRAYGFAQFIVPKAKQRPLPAGGAGFPARSGFAAPAMGFTEPTPETVDGAYEDEYKCLPPPFGLLVLTVVIIALYFVDVANGYDCVNGCGPIANDLIYDPFKRTQAWRFLTYMFVHVGKVHLAVNILVQIMLGIPLEMIHGWWRVPIVYMVGVVFGSLGTSLFDPCVKLAGASGGVYSLITAHVAAIIMNWKEMSYPLVQLFVFIVIISVDVGTAVYNRYTLKIEDSIGYTAHLFGAIAGLLMGLVVLRNLEVELHEKIIKVVAIVLLIVISAVAIMINIFYEGHFSCML